jgi:ATP-dependent Clp protease ATP-binding subunit ClpA
VKYSFDPESLQALDAAKRAVVEDADLTVRDLLSALYHHTGLKGRFPELGSHLLEAPMLSATAGRRHLSKELQGVLAPFTDPAAPATAAQLFRAVITSSEGRAALAELGVEAAEIDATIAALAAGSEPGSTATSGWRTSPQRAKVIEALGEYGRTLTALELRPANLHGIDETIRKLMQALVQRKQHSAVLVGPPGVGKTVVVQEFARRIASDDPSILPRLRDVDIFELSPAFLKAGASVVGQFEERVKALLEILRANPKMIVFVDEVHSLLQSEMHEQGPWSGASAEFKKAVGSGAVSLIGCTTLAEYRHYIEPDRALADRFTQVRLDAPSPDQTIEILRTRMPSLRAYYPELDIPDDVVPATVKLAEDYLLGGFQPRKSIRLLDQACAWCLVQDPPRAEVTEEAVRAALEAQTGQRIVDPRAIPKEELAASLKRAILGQDHLLDALADAVVTGLGTWTSASKGPRGNLFFAGPTGTGKTETAKVLATAIGGSARALIRIDCNTLQGSGYDSREATNILLGSPPGYIGYVRGQGGLLSQVRDAPNCVLLFDEIEKADPGVGKLLLQILDEGLVDDTEGSPIDFRHAFLVFTSNAGVTYGASGPIGFRSPSKEVEPVSTASASKESVMDDLRRRGFPQEFLGRNFQWFVFRSLDQDAGRKILGLQLEGLRKASGGRHPPVEVDWEPEIIDRLIESWDPQFGARDLNSLLRNRVIAQLSLAEAEGQLDGVTRIQLRVPAHKEQPTDEPPSAATRSREDDTLFIDLH